MLDLLSPLTFHLATYVILILHKINATVWWLTFLVVLRSYSFDAGSKVRTSVSWFLKITPAKINDNNSRPAVFPYTVILTARNPAFPNNTPLLSTFGHWTHCTKYTPESIAWLAPPRTLLLIEVIHTTAVKLYLLQYLHNTCFTQNIVTYRSYICTTVFNSI